MTEQVQYIMFGRVWETALLVIFLVLNAACVWGFKKAESERYTIWLSYRVLVVMVFVASGALAVAQIKPVLLVWFAPKLYLLQVMEKMVN